jgi:hypothetical protein
MIIHYTIATQQAVYEFQVHQAAGQARVTKWIRKGHKGYDRSTSMHIDAARKLARQLQTK